MSFLRTIVKGEIVAIVKEEIVVICTIIL